jgi:hypothetical protein
VRICRRCGDEFTVDVPAKGRRLCDGCRAKRATFFTCPLCGVEREIHSAVRDAQRRLMQCCECRQDELTAAFTVDIVTLVTAMEPMLDAEAITAAVVQAAPSRVERKWLAEHLAAHPDALTSQVGAPRVVCRLAAGLVATGSTSAARPCCVACGRAALALMDIDGAGWLCEACIARRRAEPCARCGKTRRVCTRDLAGTAICTGCAAKEPHRLRTCSSCGRRRTVNARTLDGGALCGSCYRSPADLCTSCGETTSIVWRREASVLCAACYVRHQRQRRQCGCCGRMKIINRRGDGDAPDLCNGCNWAAVATCTRCGEEAPGRGASKGVHVCLQCIANKQVDQLLAAPNGVIVPALLGLRDAFHASGKPRSTFGWLYGSPGARLLRRLAVGEVELSHEALDAFEQTPSLRHLRQVLVATHALSERDPHLAALERHIRSAAAGVDDRDDAKTLLGYGVWKVLARLRQRPAAPTVSTMKYARQCFDQGAFFLHWLHTNDLTLGTCSQHDLDRWLADGPDHRQRARSLLAWAAERGSITDIEVPRQEPRPQRWTADEESRWAQARRLLTDDSIDPADRVVGSLVVIYAQPVTRIVRLRRDDVVDVDGDTYLSFGKDLVFMPEPLATFLRTLPWRRQVGPSGSVPGADQWLFPGRQAGQHQHHEHPSRRLRELGIKPRLSRNQALLHFGRQVPAKVLADMLNLHPNTAVRWVKAAGGDWTRYAAGRLRGIEGPSPE